jgi:thioredoxin
MMKNRRTFLALFVLAAAPFAVPAEAFEIRPYDAPAANKAIASGGPVVLHVYASWRLQCHIQASILDNLKTHPAYDKATFFRVD